MNEMRFCGGETKKLLVTFSYERGKDFSLLSMSPADVCERCGEKLILLMLPRDYGSLQRINLSLLRNLKSLFLILLKVVDIDDKQPGLKRDYEL